MADVNSSEEIPKKKDKHVYPFDKLQFNRENEQGESFNVGEYSESESKRMAPYIHYFNRSRPHKHFTQRKVQVEVDTEILFRDPHRLTPYIVVVKNGGFVLRVYRDR